MSEFPMANLRASCYDEFCFQAGSLAFIMFLEVFLYTVQVLWPCLLYAVSDAPKTKFFYESASFKQYRSVNQHFTDIIVENYYEGDTSAYSGSMTITFPSGLLRLLPKTALAPIGFFVHVAFPSSEIFCNLSVRNSPPRAILGADLVGFQSASYARHFGRTVSRILAYESLPKGIQVKGLLFLLVPVVKPRKSGGQAEGRKTKEKGRFVDIGVFAMGIDVNQGRKIRGPISGATTEATLRTDEVDSRASQPRCDSRRTLQNQGFGTFPQGKSRLPGHGRLGSSIPPDYDVASRLNAASSMLTYQPVTFLHSQEVI
ncbi:glycosyltransferase family 20-domain-containing protein [Pisolithus croceorrhizus]|nr:glycosyltransferase family 20-domain-containing protein [Pisolithus croceorrhizus]KAI6134404.1 glycosyltransferase family 20-domain-containing protein [Pisolithus croceorrhizus]KAI6167836.1 glycosyltransferase family 20-domain-containing protein [Pisolithus thermaeus]